MTVLQMAGLALSDNLFILPEDTIQEHSNANSMIKNINLYLKITVVYDINKPGRPKGLAGPELPLDWWNPCGKLTL